MSRHLRTSSFRKKQTKKAPATKVASAFLAGAVGFEPTARGFGVCYTHFQKHVLSRANFQNHDFPQTLPTNYYFLIIKFAKISFSWSVIPLAA